ncbi:hypothetical protein RRG08_062420 [Elysia crispata]|uniref:Uncharacterized protein n=1 Tax=Elysia crispata TaxID=231223 RepID=A0AAE0ZTG8_9GAST|nr:hypothetical protein RRG08_062420 [Elysia crispata]
MVIVFCSRILTHTKMKVVQFSLAICLVAIFVCALTDDKQAELAKLQESWREARLYYEDLLAQLDTLSTDKIFAGIDKAIDLNKAWVIDRVAYNAIRANNSLYNDQIEDVNRFYNDAKSGYRVILKDLDDDDLKQMVKNELNDRILEIDRMKTMMGFSD